jgi:hypothetical protein
MRSLRAALFVFSGITFGEGVSGAANQLRFFVMGRESDSQNKKQSQPQPTFQSKRKGRRLVSNSSAVPTASVLAKLPRPNS